MVVAADRKQARAIMQFIKGLLKGTRMLVSAVKAERVESSNHEQRDILALGKQIRGQLAEEYAHFCGACGTRETSVIGGPEISQPGVPASAL